MRGRGYARHLLQQRDVLRVPAEFVIADQSAERVAAERSVLFFVNLLEDGALVELHRLVEILEQIRLADVHQLDLQAAGRLGLLHEVVQPAPGAFELLKGLGVHDFVQLLRDERIELADALVDHGLGVVGDGHLPGHHFLDQILDPQLPAAALFRALPDPAFFGDAVEQAAVLGTAVSAAGCGFCDRFGSAGILALLSRRSRECRPLLRPAAAVPDSESCPEAGRPASRFRSGCCADSPGCCAIRAAFGAA